jgi:tetratricopeptide (TPR) repeat protein
MIAHKLIKQDSQDGLYPQTWQAFKYLTQSRDAYNNYMNNKNINDANKAAFLDSGLDRALMATKFEPGYKGSYDLLSGLGFAYIELGKYYEAARIFENITQFKPFESSIGLGLAYSNQGGRNPEALDAFETATRLDSQNAYAWYAWVCQGVILVKMDSYGEAVKAFKNATRSNSQCAIAWRYEGDAYVRLGATNSSNYIEAIQCYDRAIDLSPSDVASQEKKALALERLNRSRNLLKL